MGRKPVFGQDVSRPSAVVIMLLSAVGLWVGRSVCVGIVVSASWVMLVIIIILGSRGRRL
jgi:hypothetical protein